MSGQTPTRQPMLEARPARSAGTRRAPTVETLSALMAELVGDIQHADATADQLSALISHVASLQSVLTARLVRDLYTLHETQARDGDRLLTVAEAAGRLACSRDWLYRHHHRLPFAVRNGRQLRFSALGVDRYIRQRAGRESASLLAAPEP